MTESELFPDFEFTPKPRTDPQQKIPQAVLPELLSQVRKLEPWKVLDNDHLIGVCESGAPGDTKLISVLGKAEEYFAIQVHLPPQGLEFYHAFLRNETAPEMSKLRFIDCEFVNKEKADPRDMIALGMMAEPSTKKNSIPSLRSYRPGFLPWYLDRAEIDDLIPVLRLFLHHYKEIAQNLDNFFTWNEGAEMPTIPVLALKEGQNANDPENWEVKLQEIPIANAVPPTVPESDGFQPEYEKRKVTDEIWEMACTFMPTPVEPADKSEGDRPYFPKVVAGMHDDGIGLVLVKPEIYPGHKMSDAGAIQAFFRRFSESRNCLPDLVRVTSESERLALQGLADRIGFRVAIEKQQVLPEFLESISGKVPQTDADMQEQIDQLLEVLPPGNPIRKLLLDGNSEEAFSLISQMMGGEPDNIVSGNFGNTMGDN